MSRSTYCIYTTCALLGALTFCAADGEEEARRSTKIAHAQSRTVAENTAKIIPRNVEKNRGFTEENNPIVLPPLVVIREHYAGENVDVFYGWCPTTRREKNRVKQTEFVLDDDDYTSTLYGGLAVLATVFFISIGCWCTQWSAWIRTADGRTLFRDHSTPVHLAYPTYDNLAFSSYAEKGLVIGDGVIVGDGYYEKSPNVYLYSGPRYGRCTESIV